MFNLHILFFCKVMKYFSGIVVKNVHFVGGKSGLFLCWVVKASSLVFRINLKHDRSALCLYNTLFTLSLTRPSPKLPSPVWPWPGRAFRFTLTRQIMHCWRTIPFIFSLTRPSPNFTFNYI